LKTDFKIKDLDLKELNDLSSKIEEEKAKKLKETEEKEAIIAMKHKLNVFLYQKGILNERVEKEGLILAKQATPSKIEKFIDSLDINTLRILDKMRDECCVENTSNYINPYFSNISNKF